MHSDTGTEEIEEPKSDVVADSDSDDAEELDPNATVVMAEDTFSDPDISMEVNVEKLVAELEGTEDSESNRKAEIRRRLEELAEENSFEDTYAIDVE